MPCTVPAATARSTPSLACTAPKRLRMPRSATAGAAIAVTERSELAGVVGHVVGDLDLAGDDVGLGRVDLALHVGADQLGVVLVHRVVDTAFLQPEHGDARRALVG